MAVRGRDARLEYARSSDFRFGNATLIPLSLARISPVTLLLSRCFCFYFFFSRLSGDGKHECEGTRAGTDRYTGTSSVQAYTLKRKHATPYAHLALTNTHTYSHIRHTHACARERKKLRVKLTAGHRIVGSSRSSVIVQNR